MICEVTLVILSAGFALGKAVELRMLYMINRNQKELVQEVKTNGIHNKNKTESG